MTYPASVVTRPVQVGGAISVEEGHPLTVEVTTVASRSLVHQATGTRMEKLAFERSSWEVGEAIWWEIACTDQSATYLDGETRQAIVLGPDEHTHLYTTTLRILDGVEQIAQYVIGPYPVPSGSSMLDLDTHLIPDGTAEGTLVAIPDQWAATIADADAIVGMRGTPDGIATLDSSGVVPVAQLPDFALSDDVDAGFSALPTQLADNGSALRVPLDALYPVYRMWDDVAGTYPERVPGAANWFIGPVSPGLAMDPESDRWENPDGTTLDEIVAEVQDVTSPLNAAVRTAATPERIEFRAMDLAPVDNRPTTMGTLAGAANLAMGVPVLLFGDNTVQVAGTPWRTPVGWSACRVYVDWGHNVNPVTTPQVSWQARIVGYGNGTDLTVTTGLQTLAQVDTTPPAVKTVKRFLISGNFTLDPAGSEVRVAISRLATTFGGPVGLFKLIMERTA